MASRGTRKKGSKRSTEHPAGEPPAPGASIVDDARGVLHLALEGVVGVTDIVEHLHATIGEGRMPWAPAVDTPAPGLAGHVYRGVRGVVRGVGRGIDAAFSPFGGALRIDLPEREHLRAALNGVRGDRLAAAGNPLAIPMRLGTAESDRTSRLVVFVHGLCMHDRQWPRTPASMDAAARAMGYTPVYLNYNSGQSVDINGAEFSRQLARLVASWPRRVTHLSIVAHSMGGLVTRHAAAHAERTDAAWLESLRSVVFLGTPHLGSGLERAGTRIDYALAMSPYSAPFARIGGARSAGIRDLGKDYSGLALPSGVAHVAVAGKLMRGSDGLVSVTSALGLPLPDADRIVIEGAGHLELLAHPAAIETVERTLARRRR